MDPMDPNRERRMCRTAQTWSRKPPTVELDPSSGNCNAESRNESMNSNKPKKDPSNTILAVQTEMALPRMSKSARIAELNLDTARISEQPRTVIPGTVDELIPSRRPNQVDKAQIFYRRRSRVSRPPN